MNFFAQQDRAHSNTRWLVALLLVAVATLIAATSLAVAATIYFIGNGSDSLHIANAINTPAEEHFRTILTPKLFGSVAIVVVLVVGMGSLYKTLQLKRGGKRVASELGGRLINSDTRDAHERKILNVVEEMAIASGSPVPQVYVLEDDAINAFAAGFDRRDAVIGVTRGCIEHLSRDELQGVVAHEFSHIYFGDMRLNMRLVGLLHGILVIGLIGYFLLRGSAYGHSRRRNGGAQLGLALALVIIGYCGTFFGNLIKAAVSRQREFLADASAVQFTRNPHGIAEALKKIGGWSQGSRLASGHAQEYSHLYFGEGVKRAFTSFMSTHPPLADRIRRIEPRWDGEYPLVEPLAGAASSVDSGSVSGSTHDAASLASGVTMATASAMENQVGNPSKAHIDYAHTLLEALPPLLTNAAHEPYSARALIYGLLLDTADQSRQAQIELLRRQAHPATFAEMKKLEVLTRQLDRQQYLPLIELTIPALKQLSAPQYKVFKDNLIALIKSDNKMSLFEWSLLRMVTHSVEEIRVSGRTRLAKRCQECQLLLSVITHAGGNDSTESAFDAGAQVLALPADLGLLSKSAINLPALDRALDHLAAIRPLEKPRLLKAVAACINADRRVSTEEKELFRAIADSLDCPVPPLLDDQ